MQYDSKNCRIKAAAIARGDRLSELYTLCETQEKVSTAKLEALLDNLADDMRMDAIFLSAVADEMSKLEKRSADSDTERLDYLDQLNGKLNTKSGSNYGWRLEVNHNRVALMDHDPVKKTVREAIDGHRAQYNK